MDSRMQKLLLVILALALAASPLRGAWAMPDIPATDSETHCAQMQHSMQDDVTMGASDPDCKQGCDGSCCDDSCSACVPGTSAISGTLTLAAEVTAAQHNKIIPAAFSGRTVIPPLRPPASL
jgi:hypothetical protein